MLLQLAPPVLLDGKLCKGLPEALRRSAIWYAHKRRRRLRHITGRLRTGMALSAAWPLATAASAPAMLPVAAAAATAPADRELV